jgi:hypothetical protein
MVILYRAAKNSLRGTIYYNLLHDVFSPVQHSSSSSSSFILEQIMNGGGSQSS